jgi:hypothetical protein
MGYACISASTACVHLRASGAQARGVDGRGIWTRPGSSHAPAAGATVHLQWQHAGRSLGLCSMPQVPAAKEDAGKKIPAKVASVKLSLRACGEIVASALEL